MTQQLAPTAPPADLSQELIDYIIDSPDLTADDAAHLRVCPSPNNIMGIGCDRPVHDILAAEQERQIWGDINPPDTAALPEVTKVTWKEIPLHGTPTRTPNGWGVKLDLTEGYDYNTVTSVDVGMVVQVTDSQGNTWVSTITEIVDIEVKSGTWPTMVIVEAHAHNRPEPTRTRRTRSYGAPVQGCDCCWNGVPAAGCMGIGL